MTKRNISIILILTIAWFAFMTYLSHQPGEETAETSGWLANLFGGSVGLEAFLRKAAHVVLFMVLTVLVSLVLNGLDLDWRWVMLVFVWCILDEATKPMIEGRHFEWFDVGLNAIGTGIGVLIGYGIRKKT